MGVKKCLSTSNGEEWMLWKSSGWPDLDRASRGIDHDHERDLGRAHGVGGHHGENGSSSGVLTSHQNGIRWGDNVIQPLDESSRMASCKWISLRPIPI